MSLNELRKKYIDKSFYALMLCFFLVLLVLNIVHVNNNIKLNGIIKSKSITAIKSPTELYLTEVYVSSGEKVEKGQTLARLDNVSISRYIDDLVSNIISLEKKIADLEIQRNRLQYEINIIDNEIIKAREQEKLALENYEINKKFFSSGSISGDELNKYKYDVLEIRNSILKLEKDLSSYRIRINNDQKNNTTEKEIGVIKNQIIQMQKQLEFLKKCFEFTREDSENYPFIVAPCDGIINIKDSMKDAAALVGKQFRSNETIFEIIDPDGIYIDCPLNEKDFPYIKPEDKVSIQFPAYPFKDYGVLFGIVDRLYQEPTQVEDNTVYKCEIRITTIDKNKNIKIYLGLTTYNMVDLQTSYSLLQYIVMKLFDNV